MDDYLFKSSRLGFRTWRQTDLPRLSEIHSDSEVMRFFPSPQTSQQTEQFIHRMQRQFLAHQFCYFAVNSLDHHTLIGFIGLNISDFQAHFTPCVDIGWRLAKEAWGRGYATEGARKCLEYAFHTLHLQNIKSICPVVNYASEKVMIKIGMKKHSEFEHPLLAHHESLQRCVLYEIKKGH